MIAEAASDLCFLHRLTGRAGKSSDSDEWSIGPVMCALCREPEDRLIQSDVTDSELRRVDTNGDAAGTSIDIVSRQSLLSSGVELAAAVKRERMGGNDHALAQQSENIR